ncbi:hypothetical protein, partial [Microbispora triticiradicis]|uniref:hypothetical protein n=1 Tax=Microbispora triticiradicis TaxID=2200763 RepID=UPI001AD80E9F
MWPSIKAVVVCPAPPVQPSTMIRLLVVSGTRARASSTSMPSVRLPPTTTCARRRQPPAGSRPTTASTRRSRGGSSCPGRPVGEPAAG